MDRPARAAVAGVLVPILRRGGGSRRDPRPRTRYGKTKQQEACSCAQPGVSGRIGTAIPEGRYDAQAALTVYDDFRCTACAAVDAELGPTIRALAAAGRLRVLYVVGTSSDTALEGSGAARAANAAACAQAVGMFAPYRAALYRAQPPQNDDAFADRSRLLAIADAVPGLRSHTFDTCVARNTYGAVAHRGQVRHRCGGRHGHSRSAIGRPRDPGRRRPGSPISASRFRSAVHQALKKTAGAWTETPAPPSAAHTTGAGPPHTEPQ
ncbi:DsbA family protein [Yinghuangia aomiensis]